MGWYSDDHYEGFLTHNRMFGPYWAVYWLVMTCNVVVPQLLWFRSVRTRAVILFIIALIVNVGMWAERYMIVITSLHRDFLPSSWGMYSPDEMGLDDAARLLRTLLYAAVPVHPAAADDLDRRGAQSFSGGGEMKPIKLYGIVAEFVDPESLLAAAAPGVRERLPTHGCVYALSRSMTSPRRSACGAPGCR